MTTSRGIYAKRGSLKEYFYDQLGRDTDQCIIWPYHRGSHGYGVVTLQPHRQVCVHTAACEIANGPRPAGHDAAHSCGDRGCFNPKHLRWATRAENVRDAREAGWPNGRPGPQNQGSKGSK